jgi:hypothetical protein
MNKFSSIPTNTVDLIKWLEDMYPDVFDTDVFFVGTPEYWKKAGVIELINMLKIKSGITTIPLKEN